MVWSLIQPTSFRSAVKFTPSEDCGVTGPRTKDRLQKQVRQDGISSAKPVSNICIQVETSANELKMLLGFCWLGCRVSVDPEPTGKKLL